MESDTKLLKVAGLVVLGALAALGIGKRKVIVKKAKKVFSRERS